MHNPMHPGEVLKESYLEPLSISVTDAARYLGVTRKALSEFINMKSSLSVKMAYRLAKACNTTPTHWLNMQVNYDLWLYRDIDLQDVKPFVVHKPT